MKLESKKTSKAFKRFVALVLTLAMALSLQFVIPSLIFAVGANYLDGYDVSVGKPAATSQPASLQPGQIWTGKEVIYNEASPGVWDGTITVTLSAWGASWQSWDGINYSTSKSGGPKMPLRGGLFITDELHEFMIDPDVPVRLTVGGAPVAGETLASAGSFAGKNEVLTWIIPQELFVDAPAPYTLTYTLKLDDYELDNPPAPEGRLGYWYTTGIAETKFNPIEGNPFYWTKSEITYDTFMMSMNWNNGNGFISGIVTDMMLGKNIMLGSNKGFEFEYGMTSLYEGIYPCGCNAKADNITIATPCPHGYPKKSASRPNRAPNNTVSGAGQNWFDNAKMDAKWYWWHLEWQKGGTTKQYFFTVENLEGEGKHVVYEVIFPNNGGNRGVPSARISFSDEFERKGFEYDPVMPENRDRTFYWEYEEGGELNEGKLPHEEEGNWIVVTMPIKGQVRLLDPLNPFITNNIVIEKELEGWNELDWDVFDHTPFKATVKAGDEYMVFEEIPGIPLACGCTHEYEYMGTVKNKAFASEVTFSKIHPSTIFNVPIENNAGTSVTYMVEEVIDFITLNRHTASYLLKGSGDPFSTEAADAQFEFSGIYISPGDEETIIVKNTYDHGLGFLNVHKMYDGFPSDWGISDSTNFYVRIWDVDYGNYLIFEDTPKDSGDYAGTYWCVGNDDNQDDPSAYIRTDGGAFTGTPIREISIKHGFDITVSNLWTWGRYEVQEWVYVNGDVNDWVQVREIFEDDIYCAACQLLVNNGGSPNAACTDCDDWVKDPDFTWSVKFSENNINQQPLHLNETITVSMTNTYKHGAGNLTLFKELAGTPGKYKDKNNDTINEDTLFYAKIWDVGACIPCVALINGGGIADPNCAGADVNHNYLLFKTAPELNGDFRCVGNNVDGLSEAVNGKPIGTKGAALNDLLTGPSPVLMYAVPFSVNMPIALSNLWTGPEHVYAIDVEELFDLVFNPGYADYVSEESSIETFTIGAKDGYSVTVINTFKNPEVRYYKNYGDDPEEPPVYTDEKENGSEVTVRSKGVISRPGYTFKGWSKTPTGDIDYVPGDTFTMPDDDVDLYAVWEEDANPKVIYHENAPDNIVKKESVEFQETVGSAVTVKGNEFGFQKDKGVTPRGYKFMGWSTNPAATEPNSAYDPADTFTMPNKEVNLYAVWKPIYKVIYQPDSGETTGESPEDPEEYFPGDIPETLPNPDDGGLKNDGKTFKGWRIAGDPTKKIYKPGDKLPTIVNKDIVLEPVWTPPYNVFYDPNYPGADTPVPVDLNDYDEGEQFDVIFSPNENMPKRAGYTFQGWDRNKNATNPEFKSNGTKISNIPEPGEDITLYAIWKKNSNPPSGGSSSSGNPPSNTTTAPPVTTTAPPPASSSNPPSSQPPATNSPSTNPSSINPPAPPAVPAPPVVPTISEATVPAEPEGVNLRIRKSLVDMFGNETGAGRYFAIRLYDEGQNLVGRYDIIANGPDVVINGLESGTVYYLQEEESDGFTCLGFDIVGIGSAQSAAVGFEIPIYDYAIELEIILRNSTENAFSLPEWPIPLGNYPFPNDPPMISIPPGLTPLGNFSFPNDNNPRTGVTISFTAALVAGSIAVVTRKRKSKEK